MNEELHTHTRAVLIVMVGTHGSNQPPERHEFVTNGPTGAVLIAHAYKEAQHSGGEVPERGALLKAAASSRQSRQMIDALTEVTRDGYIRSVQAALVVSTYHELS